MRRLFTSPHLTQVSMLKDLLDRAGIRSEFTDGAGALCAEVWRHLVPEFGWKTLTMRTPWK